ncbi:unnamed protein product [Ranitomeya imitator]|uniref:PDZ domain-containing protein n=1 Tax=Ranitomeya imitator TaxID=111125 RepID=A0ABN9LL90_9NEOB|nr:unnamed protein product [Ranitomeya imitator]
MALFASDACHATKTGLPHIWGIGCAHTFIHSSLAAAFNLNSGNFRFRYPIRGKYRNSVSEFRYRKYRPIPDTCGIGMLNTSHEKTMSESPGSVEALHCFFSPSKAQLIAQSIGQAFSVAYQEFLRANGINPEDLSQKEYSDIINTQEMYNDDLIHFSNSENCKELQVEKLKGEILGVVIVESGWGSILPTVILANMMNGGPAARSGKLSIGDQIMSINGTSLVGLPLATCQGIIKVAESETWDFYVLYDIIVAVPFADWSRPCGLDQSEMRDVYFLYDIIVAVPIADWSRPGGLDQSETVDFQDRQTDRQKDRQTDRRKNP